MLMKAVISSGLFLQFVGYLVMQFAKDETIALSTKNIFYIIGATIAFGVAGILIGAWRVISSSRSQSIEKHTNLKELPASEVTVGNLTDGFLSVGIRAKIVLMENSQPDIDSFLSRIKIGDPFCSICSEPLNVVSGSWMSDGMQAGFNCNDCEKEYSGSYSSVRKKARGEVRRNYDKYWSKYQEKINSLTGGRADKYISPY